MKTVTSKDGTLIAYEQMGTGPALIMVDPAGGFHVARPMQDLVPLLATRFTVFTYDRRGRGDSTDTLPYATDREVDDIAALIEAAGEPVFLYGFSSGAVLALMAAARGLAIKKIVLLEPPLERYEHPLPQSPLEKEVAELVATGQRRAAYEHFSAGIGVPAEIIASQRDVPYWPQLEAMAHTIVYDLTIIRSLPTPQLSTITTPTLVVDSAATGDFMHNWSTGTAEALPNGKSLTLTGDWHSVPVDILAPKMIEFLNA
jgi:pimeloyl-ACP methyl ester carboxylesterase